MRKLLLILAISTSAFAGTDFNCLTACTNKGYMYNYCNSACSYQEPAFTAPQIQDNSQIIIPAVKQTDYKCVNDCTKQGYMYNFCTQRCSY